MWMATPLLVASHLGHRHLRGDQAVALDPIGAAQGVAAAVGIQAAIGERQPDPGSRNEHRTFDVGRQIGPTVERRRGAALSTRGRARHGDQGDGECDGGEG